MNKEFSQGLDTLRELVSAQLRNLETETVSDSRRWFHGRGQCYPGLEFLAIDYFAPVLLVTFFQAPPIKWEEAFWSLFESVNVQRGGETLAAIICQRRYEKGAPTETRFGELPAKMVARRGPLRFDLDLSRQQNIGFFLDIESAREWLENTLELRSRPSLVLNLFAYTCAFSVVAHAAGAAKIVNVDMSRAALSRGRINHQINGQSTDNVIFLQEDILKSWGRIKKHGPYDVLIIDPPSYQPGSFVAEKDYTKLLRRIPQLASSGADVLCCLNSPELNEAFIDDCMAAEGVPCEKVQRLSPNADFPDIDPQKQLKLLHYRFNP